MRKIKTIITAALAAATVAGGMAVATESSAQSRYYRRHNDTGTAVAAGIAGLALGAALSGGSSRYYGSNYGYYGPGPGRGYGYDYPRGYGRGGYYDRGYYAPRGYYGRPYARLCTYWRYDRWGRPFPVEGRC